MRFDQDLKLDDYSKFRGVAGQVIVAFVKPGSIVDAVPVLLFLAVPMGASVFFLPEGLFPFDLLIWLVLISYAVSRFAIPASQGYYAEGWFSEYNSNRDSLAFCLRYIIITVCWAIPCYGAFSLIGTVGADIFQMGLNPMSIASSGLVGIASLLLLVVVIFAPVLGFLISTASDSVYDLITAGAWGDLISNHKGNLVVFYASMIGGVITFWMLYFFPLLLITITASALSAELGTALIGFVFSLPLLMAPILLGRLCGAFVYGIRAEDEELHEAAETPPQMDNPSSVGAVPGFDSTTNSAATPAMLANAGLVNAGNLERSKASIPPLKTPVEYPNIMDQAAAGTISNERRAIDYTSGEETSFQNLLKKLENIADLGVKNALFLAENRSKSQPKDAFVAAEVSLLSARIEVGEDTLKTMATSIPLALDQDIDKLAMKLLIAAGKDRFRIELASPHWEKLATLFGQAGQFRVATLCLQPAGKLTPEAIGNYLESAKARKKADDVSWLCNVMRKKFPDSPQAEQFRGV